MDPTALHRQTLRQQLLAERKSRGTDPEVEAALGRHLREVVTALEPEVLGVYWPVRLEFNPLTLLAGLDARQDPESTDRSTPVLALPWVTRNPAALHYRRWDGQAPRLKDEVGIPASDGARVVPDVVLVPCVGYTDTGLRLGYGGGYFDRFLAAHPHVTAVGVAPSWARVALEAQPHDIALPILVTEAGVITP